MGHNAPISTSHGSACQTGDTEAAVHVAVGKGRGGGVVTRQFLYFLVEGRVVVEDSLWGPFLLAGFCGPDCQKPRRGRPFR